MITIEKVTEIFCTLDKFCKNLDAELTKNLHITPTDKGYKRMRNRKGQIGPRAKLLPSCCATILALSVASSAITSFS